MNELTETEIDSIESIPPRDFRQLIPSMGDTAIDRVRQLEELALTCPQIPAVTQHILHGGIYSRTIHIPQGAVLTGALVKIPTMLIVNGFVEVIIGDEAVTLEGHNIFAASANRKQAFIAIEDTTITMQFVDNRETKPATDELDIQELEAMFTDEAHMLFSRRPDAENVIIITGE